jgi:hypothetical protein
MSIMEMAVVWETGETRPQRNIENSSMTVQLQLNLKDHYLSNQTNVLFFKPKISK